VGLAAIKDYIGMERVGDNKKWRSPALFLSATTSAHGNGRLNIRVVNTVWNEVCKLAGAGDHTPHDARHAMGRHLIDKTGNIAAVQRRLSHTNPAYSMQYAPHHRSGIGRCLR
jgi:integrase